MGLDHRRRRGAGPGLGGWLAVHASWRWAFGINVPLAVLVFVGVLVFLAPSPGPAGTSTEPVLSVVGLGLVAFALVEGRIYGWVSTVQPLRLAGLTWDSGPSPVLAALVLAAVLLIVFVRRQAGSAARPPATTGP